MKGNAALLWEQPGRWDVGEVDLDPPQRGEVLVRLVATGLCHSDDHFATNDIPLLTCRCAPATKAPVLSSRWGQTCTRCDPATTS